MLENDYSQTRTIFTFVKVYFWLIFAVYFIAAIAFGVFKDDKGSSLQTFGILTVLGIGLYIYLLLKYGVRRKSLQLYLMHLANGDAVQALEAGRRYYSIRRKGLSGADGSGLAIYDEQAIQNDIVAFMHGGTRNIDYDATENAFTPTKLLMAAGCAVLFIGTAYFIAPKSQAEPLAAVNVPANFSDYSNDPGPQQAQELQATLPTSTQGTEEQTAEKVVEQSNLQPDSLQQETERITVSDEDAPSSDEQNLDVLGTWNGTLGGKTFVLQIDETAGGKVTGWNKTGDNKRPVTGTVTALTEDNSNVKYELTLNEPGSDKWDGVFTLTLTAPTANAAPTALAGEWKSFNGKLAKQVDARKTEQ